MITKIMKFGGSSVADDKNINRVIDIISLSLGRGENLVVVVSAFRGITDELILLAKLASKKDPKYKDIFQNICARHDQVVAELVSSQEREKVLSQAGDKYIELKEIIRVVFAEKNLSSDALDAAMSFGEQLSAYIISEAIKSRGIACRFVDARAIIKTDNNFGGANVDIKNSYKLISENFKNADRLSIMGGFIGSTKEGVTTTLGRGGSDYTASLVGAALHTSTIEIWTDVDGLMTADPRKAKDAFLIPEITYEEAERMANMGAKVIHHKTMKPARMKGIPLYIKNTFNPEAQCTKISDGK